MRYIWESRECQEQDNSSFHVIGGKEKDRKAAVHNGTSEAFYWRWEEKAESQAQAEKRGRQRKKISSKLVQCGGWTFDWISIRACIQFPRSEENKNPIDNTSGEKYNLEWTLL